MAREKPAYRDNLEFLLERSAGKAMLNYKEVGQILGIDWRTAKTLSIQFLQHDLGADTGPGTELRGGKHHEKDVESAVRSRPAGPVPVHRSHGGRSAAASGIYRSNDL